MVEREGGRERGGEREEGREGKKREEGREGEKREEGSVWE